MMRDTIYWSSLLNSLVIISLMMQGKEMVYVQRVVSASTTVYNGKKRLCLTEVLEIQE